MGSEAVVGASSDLRLVFGRLVGLWFTPAPQPLPLFPTLLAAEPRAVGVVVVVMGLRRAAAAGRVLDAGTLLAPLACAGSRVSYECLATW